MFEYETLDYRKVSIIPSHIVCIEENGQTMCTIYTISGTVIVVREKYETVKQHIANYLPATP